MTSSAIALITCTELRLSEFGFLYIFILLYVRPVRSFCNIRVGLVFGTPAFTERAVPVCIHKLLYSLSFAVNRAI